MPPPALTTTIEAANLPHRALCDAVDLLSSQREASAERDEALCVALREWGKREFGSVDNLCVEVGRQLGVTFSHVRSSLFQPNRSQAVLDAAVALYRERSGTERTVGAPAGGGPA